MNSKLHAKFLTMAAATLGLSLVGGGCAKKGEPAAEEGGEAASGAEHSCGSGSCGGAGAGEAKGDTTEAAGDTGAAPTEGAVEAE